MGNRRQRVDGKFGKLTAGRTVSVTTTEEGGPGGIKDG